MLNLRGGVIACMVKISPIKKGMNLRIIEGDIFREVPENVAKLLPF